MASGKKTSQAETAGGLCLPAFALAEAECRSALHRPPRNSEYLISISNPPPQRSRG